MLMPWQNLILPVISFGKEPNELCPAKHSHQPTRYPSSLPMMPEPVKVPLTGVAP